MRRSISLFVPLLLLLLPASCRRAGPDSKDADARTGERREGLHELFEIGEREHEEELGENGEEGEEEAGGAKWWWLQRTYPTGKLPDKAYSRALSTWRGLPRRGGASRPLVPAPPPGPDPAPPPDPESAQWISLGPAPLDNSKGLPGYTSPNHSPSAGRVTAVAVDPSSPSTLYVGYAMGGVWKSTDSGQSWTPVMDDQPSLAVGAIAIDPAAPGTVYVGTGDPALFAGYAGKGIFKSTDGGKTWAAIGGDQFEGVAIAGLVVDGGDLYVAAGFAEAGRGNYCTALYDGAPGQGLYRSSDGGKNWSLLRKGTMVDLQVDTRVTPRRIFVSDVYTGIFRSDDGGQSWDSPAGLPDDVFNSWVREKTALSPDDPSLVYIAVGVPTSGIVYRSIDGGATFAPIPGAPEYCEGNCYYDNSVLVDPGDPNALWLGGSRCGVWRGSAVDSNAPAWSNVSLPNHDCGTNNSKWPSGYVHPDIHVLVADPTNPKIVYAGGDGGLARTTDGGATWARLNQGVGTVQLYGICLDPVDPEIVYGGAQDNGTMRRTGKSNTWTGLTYGDGGQCAIDPKDPLNILVSVQYASVIQSTDGFKSKIQQVFGATPGCAKTMPGCGDRVAFSAPLVGDPSTPGTFYVATHRLWKTTDGGTKASWKAISGDLTGGTGSVKCTYSKQSWTDNDVLTAIGVSRSAPDTIYAGSAGGVLSRTTDGGASWTKISKAPLPTRYASAIAVDPLDSKVVYVAFSGFDATTPQTPGHVFSSKDGGETWAKLDIGVDVPVNALIAHPAGPGLIYAGTDLGVMVSSDSGKTWSVLGEALPNTAVFSLAFHKPGNRLVAGTFGRSAWGMDFTPGTLTASPGMIAFEASAGQADPAAQAITVGNTEVLGSSIDFTVASDAAWLTVDKASGAAAGALGIALQISAKSSAQKAGEYDAHVTITPAAGGQPITVPVHLSVKGSTTPVEEEGGCGCRTAGSSSGSGSAVIALGLAGLLARRRRRG
ncbi:MAG: MYXO-CTERM sorting domain-containing protein [Minicystis sp.]